MLALAAGCSKPVDLPPAEPPAPASRQELSLDQLREISLSDLENERVWRSYRVSCKKAGPVCTSRMQRELEAMLAGDSTRALVYTRLGQLHFSLGRRAQAQRAYRQALDAAGAEQDSCAGVKLYYLLAASVPSGEEKARLLRDCVSEADRCDQPEFARRAINKLALDLRQRGLYLREKRALDELLAREDPAASVSTSLQLQLRLADWNRRMGRLDQAQSRFEQVLERLRGLGDKGSIAVALMQLGVIHIDSHRPEQAREVLLEAARMAGESEHPEWARDAAVLAATALLRSGRFGEALGEFKPLVADAETVGDRAAVESLLYQGEALRGLGRLEPSVASYRRALDLSSRAASRELGWEIQAGLAVSLRERGDLPAAREHARDAVALIEGLRESVTGEGQSELTHFLHLRADAYTVLALSSAALDPDHLGEPFEAVERSHARVLRESLALEDGVGSSASSATISLTQLRERLSPGDLLLAYQLGEQASVLLAVDHQGASAHPLSGRQILEDSVETYLGRLLAPLTRVAPESSPPPDPSALAKPGAELFQQLLGPVAQRLASASRVFIVPDRKLHRLPFEALPLPGTSAGSPPTFVGMQSAVSYLPAASFYQAPRSATYENALVVVATEPWPEYDLPELEFAGVEAAAVAELYPAPNRRVLGGGQTTEKELLSALDEGPDLLHLAAHALVLPREGPKVLVGRGPQESGDAVLDADAVARLSSAPRLVILSACDTAAGDLLGGEGVLGLVRAFTLAGSRNVVASLWPVEDASAARLMVFFHRALREGENPSRAMLSARREMAAEPGSHPYHWAGFVVYGAD